jgi:N-methylhydantoinase A
MADARPGLRLGVDIGGTFTDFVIYDPQTGQIQTFKRLSTPHNPAEAVLAGLHGLGQQLAGASLTHGSTVATNALLERKGARTALVTTCGCRDVLQIGRQNRPALYDLFADPLPALVPAERRLEVDERVDAQGKVLSPLTAEAVGALLDEVQALQPEAVAICLLFSFLHPEHEAQLATALRSVGYPVSVSSEILPEYREYERTSTTVVNAYVSPVLERYLAHLENQLPGLPLRVMQSNGGMISVQEARHSGVHCILSGPAGGVIGARYVAEAALGRTRAGVRLITFDMGGTSTDVSLVDGSPRLTTEANLGGCPIRIPVLDIHTIGAGGGSLARLDPGGLIQVGPQSAGADPGPACYGRGDLPTVTDANLVLGRLAAEHFLGGQMPLDAARAHQVLARLGEPLGLNAEQAALGVVEIVNAHMERALRVISVERGYDPQGDADQHPFTLLSFGGAGGLHAADLARRLGIPHVLIPPLASTLSAFGMLAANISKDYTQTVMLPGDTPLPAIASALAPLAARAQADLLAEGVLPTEIVLERALDMRYRGQSYELTIPFSSDPLAAFHQAHQREYGYAQDAAPVQIVNLRLRAIGLVTPPPLVPQPEEGLDPASARLETRPVVLAPGVTAALPFYRGEALRPGQLIAGPAVVVRADTSIMIGPSDQGLVDPYSNLIISINC